MESTTESLYVSSSPEQQQRRSSSPPPPQPQQSQQPAQAAEDYIEKLTHVRFLVSNVAAGSVIGKGGSTITDYQSQSGSRIQLSRNNEFFPGTSDRIVLISGTIDGILKAVELVLSKLLSELHVEDNNDANPRTRVKLIVPNICCGGIIGKGGSTIKSYIEDSQAGIKISPLDNNYFGLSDRLVTVTGTIEEQKRAIDLILSKLAEDHHYPQSMNAAYSYAGVYSSGFHGVPYPYVLPSVPTATYNVVNYGPGGPGMKFQSNKPTYVSQEDRSSSMTIAIADEYIGLVVGRGGRSITEISQITGARIKISDRGDFISGTSDRKVTITGSQRAIQAAEAMILQKVAYASERVMD